MMQAAMKCNKVSMSESELEVLRKAVAPQSSCAWVDVTTTKPADVSVAHSYDLRQAPIVLAAFFAFSVFSF